MKGIINKVFNKEENDLDKLNHKEIDTTSKKKRVFKACCKYGVAVILGITVGSSIGGVDKVSTTQSKEAQSTIESKTKQLDDKKDKLDEIDNKKNDLELQLKKY